jgi:glycosyltransferase involved in cell wall biosynthesis
MRLLIIADPALSVYGSLTPVLLLSREFTRRGYEVVVISPKVENIIQEMFQKSGVKIVDLGVQNLLFSEPSKSFFEYWAREALLSANFKLLRGVVDEESITLNFSNTMIAKADVWYAQGPVHKALESIACQLSMVYKLLYAVSEHIIKYLDQKLIRRFVKASKLVITNSRYQKEIYEKLGIMVHGVIYGPLDTEFFQPTTRRPREDYVLTYFGKEADYMTVKKVADKGVKIKAFGSKATSIVPKYVLNNPNIEVLAYVTDSELVELYSNALFTLFPFTEEPFGYVPVESMACGTPVLTYNKQGPSETVINGVTGWLANSDEELIRLALMLWKNGYPSVMRSNARKRALDFDVKKIADEWIKLIEHIRE